MNKQAVGSITNMPMQRREFLKVAGVAGLAAALPDFVSAAPSARTDSRLFPTDLPGSQWVPFRAAGFSRPVTGVLYRGKDKVSCGMPLGGVDTGCLDLAISGLLGYCTIFNSHVPRRGPMNLPFLALSSGGKTWVLCRKELQDSKTLAVNIGGSTTRFHWPESVRKDLKLDGVETAREIHYWGHYPVADLEFETEAPISVGLRAWSPFLPGDVIHSMIPGIVFEVHLRNPSGSAQKGTLAFSFPGPAVKEAGTNEFSRTNADGTFKGVCVSTELASYALGLIGKEALRLGGGLGADGAAWTKIASALPEAGVGEPGSSAAVDFSLAPGQEKSVRFVLAWHASTWRGSGANWIGGEVYTHMYAKYYPDPLGTAKLLAKNHRSLLKRVLAWQQVIYAEASLPGWLQDALINNFHLITETGLWAQAKPPIPDWCKAEDGLWGLNENPRGCPQIECLGCSYYGGMAVLYAFPELTLSTLRGYKAYQSQRGAYPAMFGGYAAGGNCSFIDPPRHGSHVIKAFGQTGQGSSFTVAMIGRYWKITGNDEVLREFYPSLKKATEFIFNLNPTPKFGLLMLPDFDLDESYESTPQKGLASHVASIRLYHLKLMESMAVRMKDEESARKYREWYRECVKMMDEYLWTGSHYIQHKDPVTGETAKAVMGYQLDGEFMGCFDGLGAGVLPADHVSTTLSTLKKTAMATWGPRVWSDPHGGPARNFNTGYWTADGVHAPGALMLAMTYMYAGQVEYGLEIARKIMFNMICRQGWAWDMPILYHGETGAGIWGNDYSQMMMVWNLPAAIKGQDLSGPCKQGGLVDRILRASRQGAAQA